MKLTRALAQGSIKALKLYGATSEYNREFNTKVAKSMTPYVSAISPTEENNYYLYHIMRVERETAYLENARIAKKKLLAEKALNLSSLEEQHEVEYLGQEKILHTYDWFSE